MTKKLTLEYCIEDIADFHVSPSLAVENTLRARDSVQSEFPDIELSLLPYGRIKSIFTGGRNPKFERDKFLRIAKELNGVKIACAVVLNGGLLMPRNMELSWGDPRMEDIKATLDTLAESDVDNAVTIYHDALLDVVHERYPDLKKIASCIRFVGGRKGEFKNEPGDDEYDKAFADKRFSYIVPLNQHTTYDFLKRFEGDADRIIAFLSSGCCSDDLYQCYHHYCGTERGNLITMPNKLRRSCDLFNTPDKDQFAYIKSGVYENSFSSCRCGQLYSRPRDFGKLVQMGVNKYKVPPEESADTTTTFWLKGMNILRELININED